MNIPFFQVDAFASNVFQGNPAGVCILKSWLSPQTMQAIASENNLSETAFVVPKGEDFEIRWFTPRLEVDLCGHATLASAHVVFSQQLSTKPNVRFQSQSGALEVTQDGDMLALDFPSRPPKSDTLDPALLEGLGVAPLEVQRARDSLILLRDEAEVRSLQPNMDCLMRLDTLGVIVTAKGDQSDFVSRFFAPKAGIPEDPVTGSAHCTLIPYCAKKLGRKNLHAFQISPRGGELFCEDQGDRVHIAGRAITYLKGEIFLDDTHHS